uniref:Uncharacterized protein n=1 Tax=Oryza sativa subsp. japonica TaxID=39947 RepID=Q6K333_ORYSJ|nr:hypothetical protein [Oryza sativa Japonica Group]BAD23537.1 hypothetical protein [Oryza sativa Japonica Group]
MPSSPESLGGYPGDSVKIPWSPEESRPEAPSSQEHAYLKKEDGAHAKTNRVMALQEEHKHYQDADCDQGVKHVRDGKA